MLRTKLLQTFRNDKDSIAQYIRECLQFQFSKMTKKTLRRFETRLFSCSNSQAKFFLRKLALCIWSIRVRAQKFETKHNMSVMQMTTSEQQSGMLPFARVLLTWGHETPQQSCLVSFLIDSGSQINIMSLNHLQQIRISKTKIKPVLNDYII